MKRYISKLFWVVWFIAGSLVFASPDAQDPGQLGKITLPKDFEVDTSTDTDVLPRGEYLINIHNDQLGLAYRKNGAVYGFDIPTETEKNNEAVLPPKIDVSTIRDNGADQIRITVISGLKMYTSLLRCAVEGRSQILPAKSIASLDPRIVAELDALKQAIALLDQYAGTIWPNWTEYTGLEYKVTFPNRVRLIVTRKQRMPALYRQMDITMRGGRKVFIKTDQVIPGRLGPIRGWHGRGGGNEVGMTLNGMVGSAATEPKQTKISENTMRFSRMMVYVHESFHCMQNWRMVHAEMRGLLKPLPPMSFNFIPTLSYATYSEIEGEALIRSFNEANDSKAFELFKEFWVARELKLKEMAGDSAAADAGITMREGTATYSGFKMAALIRDANLRTKTAVGQTPRFSPLVHADDYLDKEMKDAINRIKGVTMDVYEKPYVYGAFWSLLLDRFFPAWKQEFFEKYRSLDEITETFMNMTAAEKSAIGERLKINFDFENISARHGQAIKERDDAVAATSNRKGRIYLVDIRHARGGFDIKSRKSIPCKEGQIYPTGLTRFVWGSLTLKSEEVPMRFLMDEGMLEWIDTEARSGEKGYNLQYKSRKDDLYSEVTLKTKGFSMTAKAVKIAENDEIVQISIWD